MVQMYFLVDEPGVNKVHLKGHHGVSIDPLERSQGAIISLANQPLGLVSACLRKAGDGSVTSSYCGLAHD
jgi:hypothetical protein